MNDDLEQLPTEELERRLAVLKPPPVPEHLQPDADLEKLSDDQLQQRLVAVRRQQFAPEIDAARQQADKEGPESSAHWATRSAAPWHGMLSSFAYGRALKNLQAGQMTDPLFGTSTARDIALYEKQHDAESKQPWQTNALQSVLGLPAIAGEAFVGGTAARGLGLLAEAGQGASLATKVGVGAMNVPVRTAFMPSMYVNAWEQNNIRAGRDPLDLEGLPSAFAKGMVDTAALEAGGAASRAGVEKIGLGGLAGKAAGVAAQGPSFAASQAVSDFVAGKTGLAEDDGVIADIVAGKYGEAGKKAAQQMVIGLAFGLSHELQSKGVDRGRIEDALTRWTPDEEVRDGTGPAQGNPPALAEGPGAQSETPALPAKSQPALPGQTPTDEPGSTDAQPNRVLSGQGPTEEVRTPFHDALDFIEQQKALPAPEIPTIEEDAAKPDEPPKLSLKERMMQRGREQAADAAPRTVDTSDARTVELPEEVTHEIENVVGSKAAEEPEARQAATDEFSRGSESGFQEGTRRSRPLTLELIKQRLGRDYDKYTALVQRDDLSGAEQQRLDDYIARASGLNRNEGSLRDIAANTLNPKTGKPYSYEYVRKNPEKFGYAKAAEPEPIDPAEYDAREKMLRSRNEFQPQDWKGLMHDADMPVGWQHESQGLRDAVHELWQDDVGSFGIPDPQTALDFAMRAYDRAVNIKDYTASTLDALSQHWFPAVGKLNKDIGFALGQRTSAPKIVQDAQSYFPAKLFDGLDPKDAPRYWTAFLETRQRYAKSAALDDARKASLEAHNARQAGDMKAAREWAQRATDAMQDAGKISSVMTQKDSPIPTEPDYKAVLGEAGFKKFIMSYFNDYVPWKERYAKQSMGIDEHDDIQSRSQIPGFPMYAAQQQDPAKQGAGLHGPGEGPKQIKLKRNMQSRAAGLDGDNYEMNGVEAIKRDIENIVPKALDHELFRIIHEEGFGGWGRRGEENTAPNGHPAEELPNVDPPRGTQPADVGETSFFIDKRIAEAVDNVRKHNKTPTAVKVVSAMMRPFSTLQLASGIDALQHTLNMGTFVWKQPLKATAAIINQIHLRMTDNIEYKRQLLQLAESGGSKPAGFEAGSILPERFKKFDPTYYAGQAIDGLNNIGRLAAGEVFDSITRSPGYESHPIDRADFIQSEFGNYFKQGQPYLVRLLRELNISPFITAHTTFTAKSVRLLAGGSGMKPETWTASAKMRAATLGTIATYAAGVAASNYAMWGRADGDRKTPWGAVKLGVDPKSGKTQYLDVMAYVGVRRGLRFLGVDAAMNSNRRGENTGKTEDKVLEAVYNDVIHPLSGPPVQAAHTAITGKDAMGRFIADKAKGNQSQMGLNIKSAALNLNNILATATRADETEAERKKSRSVWDVVKKTIKPVVPKESNR